MVVLASDDHRSVVGKRHVVALVVFDGALQCTHQLPAATEHRQVEVVVIVGYNHLAVRTNADADRVISNTLTADDTQRSAVVRKHLKSNNILTLPYKSLTRMDGWMDGWINGYNLVAF